jgi:hypothetical protein
MFVVAMTLVVLQLSTQGGDAVDSGQCCSTRSFGLTKRGEVTSFGCGDDGSIATLDTWFSGDSDGALRVNKTPANWRSSAQKDNYVWLAFAGDSELRLEFWALARHIGQGYRCVVHCPLPDAVGGRSTRLSCIGRNYCPVLIVLLSACTLTRRVLYAGTRRPLRLRRSRSARAVRRTCRTASRTR